MPRSNTGKYARQISFQLDEDLFVWLKKVSTDFGMPMSWIIRRAVEQYLRSKGF
jgi:hypothetical protein